MSISTLPKSAPDSGPEPLLGLGQALVTIDADLDLQGRFAHSSLEVFDDRLEVKDGSGRLDMRLPIKELKSARTESLVGGGRLEATLRDGKVVPIAYYSMTHAAAFSEVARGIEQLVRGEDLRINIKKQKLRCDNCGRLLPERDGACPTCVNRSKTMLRIARFMKPYQKVAISLAIIATTMTLLNLIPPLIQGAIIDGVIGKVGRLPQLFRLLGLWALVLLVSAGLQVASGRLVAFLGGNVAADLRGAIYRAIEFLQLGYFDRKQVGAIASRITQDTDRIWGFLVEGLPYLLTNSLLMLGVIVYLFKVNTVLATAILAPMPIVGFISVVFWRPISHMFHQVNQKWARFHTHINESITGIRVVKAFAKEDLEFARFTKRNEELRDSGIKVDRFWFTAFAAMTFFVTLGTVICWAVGGFLIAHGKMTLGQFWTANAFLALLYGPLQWFANVNSWFSRAMAGADRIFEVMDTESEKYEGKGLQKPIEGEVSFENVRFGYDKSNPVLKGLTFKASPGEMIGLVGKSGAGKSTTINLLCRFYEPDSGSITVDGVDYRDFDLQALRRQVGIVLQEPFLFNGTIGENISYGKPNATLDEVIAAARLANAHEFILAKSDGYDTLVGEKGSKLSGGERQRVSIARAILHDPKILILDEATSSVDVETERQIQEALGRLIKGRTTFAIAHRLSTLRNATRLIVLEKGEIAEIGSHAELMEKKGAFFNLVQSQTALNEIVGEFAAL